MSRPLGGSSTRITTAVTTSVAARTARLRRVVIGTAHASTITFNDALGTRLVLGASFPVGSHEIDIEFAGKLEVVTAGTPDITIVWD